MTNVPTPQLFHAVILHHDGTFGTESFMSAEDMAARLKQLIDHDVSVSCFHGSRVHISKPPMRHLMLPDKNVPLFDTGPTIEPDESGYLGVDPIHLESPPQLQPPAVGRPAENDDFFSDDDADAINIFDHSLPDPDA